MAKKTVFQPPEFPRPYHWVRVRLGDSWRRPKGIDNKLRHAYKGYPPTVNVGYRKPREVRGIHPSGLKPVLISNISELDSVDPATQCVIIAGSVGAQKFAAIEAAAIQKGIYVVNGKQKKQVEAKGEG